MLADFTDTISLSSLECVFIVSVGSFMPQVQGKGDMCQLVGSSATTMWQYMGTRYVVMLFAFNGL